MPLAEYTELTFFHDVILPMSAIIFMIFGVVFVILLLIQVCFSVFMSVKLKVIGHSMSKRRQLCSNTTEYIRAQLDIINNRAAELSPESQMQVITATNKIFNKLFERCSK